MGSASTPSAPLLLIDIGNTHVKLRGASREALLGSTRRLPTAAVLAEQNDPAVLADALRAWRGERVVLCSVVPAATQRVVAALPTAVPVAVLGAELPGLPVDLSAYTQRHTLGADRLANMAGALALQGRDGGRPLIVVDFGTAATFNVLEGNGRFLGGVIAPGLASMTAYLPASGAQLPALGGLRVPGSALGKSTREAMLAGTVLGYRGLVRELLVALLREQPGALVVATGGDGEFVAGLLPEIIHRVEPDLTMHGLRQIALRL